MSPWLRPIYPVTGHVPPRSRLVGHPVPRAPLPARGVTPGRGDLAGTAPAPDPTNLRWRRDRVTWVPLLIVGPKVVGEKPGYSAPLLWVEIREIRWERRPNGSGMQSDRCIDIRLRDDHIAHAAAGAPLYMAFKRRRWL
jgi:hypothetical protein